MGGDISEREPGVIAVLGSNSFTGSHFVDYALDNSDARIVGISRSPEYEPVFLPYRYRKAPPARFSFHQLDLNRDCEQVLALLDRERPRVVVNFAAQGEVRNSWRWPDQWFETNCLAVVRLADALARRDYVECYVVASTPEVYGATGENMTETDRYAPSTPYAASKLAGDLFLGALHRKTGFPVVLTRAANVFGLHQQLYRIIPRTAIYLRLGRTVELHGGGKARRSFVHVRDVARATWLAIQQGRPGEVYHVAPAGEVISIRDLVARVCRLAGGDFARATRMVEENFGQDSLFSLDASKARRELGWEPEVTLDQGIEETVAWVDDNWDTIRTEPLEYVHRH